MKRVLVEHYYEASKRADAFGCVTNVSILHTTYKNIAESVAIVHLEGIGTCYLVDGHYIRKSDCMPYEIYTFKGEYYLNVRGRDANGEIQFMFKAPKKIADKIENNKETFTF